MQYEPNRGNGKDGVSILYFLSLLMSAAVTPFIRVNFGREAFGGPGIWGIGFWASILMLLWWIETADPIMQTYFMAWIVCVLCHRLRSFRLASDGREPSSRYRGYPWLAAKLFRCTKENFAKTLEIPLVLCVGLVVKGMVSETLGFFLCCAAGGLGIVRALEARFMYLKVQRARDAQREMAAFTEYYRGERNDW
jgi:hypothetical protein